MTPLFADLRVAMLLAAIPLTACATATPSGPTVFALPRAGESLTQLQTDDLACRNYVQTHTAPPGATQAAANHSEVGSAAVGTAAGATAGALLGAAAGNAGVGAAAGAGAGLLTGAAVGTNNASAIAGDAQAQYDAAYAQCMTNRGYTVENTNLAATKAPPGYGYAYPGGYPCAYAYPGGGYPYYGPYPYFIGTAPFFFFGPHFHHGFDRDDFHHHGFDHDDFHHHGFDHEGFHHEGFHHEGFGHGGFGHEGGHFGH